MATEQYPNVTHIGRGSVIDPTVRIFGAGPVRIGERVRIDAYCVITVGSAGVTVEDNVHVAAFCFLSASGAALHLESFCGVSSHVAIFTSTEDYSGGWMSNPTVPAQFKNVRSGPVRFQRHALVGSHAVIMPGVTLGLGCSVGAASFVNKSIPDGAVVAGTPLRIVGHRDVEELLRHEQMYRDMKK